MRCITSYDKLERGDWFILNNNIYVKLDSIIAYNYDKRQTEEIDPIRPWVLGITTKIEITGLLDGTKNEDL